MKKEFRESLELRANFTKVEQFEYFLNSIRQNYEKVFSSTAGFEPAIFWSVVRRVIRCATRPLLGKEQSFGY